MQKNITINCVSPGFIQSKMTEKIPENIKDFNIKNSYKQTWNRRGCF